MRRVWVLAAIAACGGDNPRTVYFDLGHTGTPDTFWNYPFPSDNRLDAAGAPDLTGFPNRRNVPILSSLMSIVSERRGFPVMPAAYFRFTATPTTAFTLDEVLVAGPIYLVDIDPASPERGTKFPVVAATLAPDGYVPSNLVAVAPRPGIVLRANTKYAYFLAKLDGFERPSQLSEADPQLAPVWGAVDAMGIARDDVLVATVFTTGDEVGRTRARSEAILAAYQPAITGLSLVGATTYDGFCRLSGTITMPQFQQGTAPFDSAGGFALDGNDVPMKQGELAIPITITLPKSAMPATGWPLYQFFHGSGGLSTGLVDLGRSPDAGDHPEPGKGPGYVVALHGIAGASAALPLNPERYPGATDYQYLNINNLAAFPHTFQQGVFEQRLFTSALVALQIPQTLVAACTGISSPSGAHFFDPQKLVAGGQSMGGMYTNLVGAVEPRFGALVPTGAAGSGTS